MANQHRERSFYKKNGIPAPCTKIFFYNKELVKVLQINRGNDTVYLLHYHSGKTLVASWMHFQTHKRRAWQCYYARLIIGRSLASWEKYLSKRMIPRPHYANVGNMPKAGIRAYYSEDHLYEIRDAIAEISFGAPPQKGYPTKKTKVLTKAELRAKIGDGRMLYVQNDEGEFVPIWSESV